MKRWIAPFAFFVAFVLQGCELGLSPGGGTGAEGVIVDPSGHPSAGVKVWMHPADNGPLLKASAALAAARAESTFTDAQGKYRFRKLNPGVYNLQASQRAGDTTYALLVRNVPVSKSRVDLGADTLRLSGSLRVTVRDVSGAPVAGVRCRLVGTAWEAVSDSAGVCVIEGAAPGGYGLEVAHGNLKASGTVFVQEGFESSSTVRFASGSQPPTVQAWKTYVFEGYRFQGPPDLKPSPRVDGIDSWSDTYANAELAVTQSSGMVVPAGDRGPLRERQIRWSDSSQGILKMFLDSGGVWHAQLTVSIQRGGAWEERGGILWTASADNPAAWDQAEQILASLRPVDLWSGPLPESAEEVRVLPVSTSLPPGIQLNAVAWNGMRFAAVGTQGLIATSLDGLNWTHVFSEKKEEFTALTAATYPRFVAVGSDSAGAASIAAFEDEKAVVTSSVGTSGGKFYGVAHGGDRLVAVNYDGVWSSDNGGLNWTQRVSGYPAFSVTWTGTQFVAVGYLSGNGHVRLVTSPDGLSWTQRFTGSATAGLGWDAVAASGDRIVATGKGLYGDMGVSTNGGRNWSVKKPEGMNILSLAWAWNRFVAVGSYEGKPAVWTSPDGGSWKRQPFESSMGSSFLGAAASPSRLVVVGSGIAATP
jgi:hypothetical protein